MKQIPLTKGKFAIVDDDDYGFINQWKWQYNKRGYAIRDKHIGIVDGKRIRKSIYMHREIVKTPPNMDTDHINGDGLDNRKANLRICSTSQNTMNQRKSLNRSSKFKGVCWYKRQGKWTAYITKQQERLFLGYFASEEAAAIAYNNAAIDIFGDFANLNKI